MSPSPPSITDVARLAGVSRSAVSFALNGKGKVAPETLRRIEDAARQLGYRPNHAARSLKTGRTRILALQVSGVAHGVLVPTTAISTYFVEVLNAASAEAQRSGWLMVVASNSMAEDFGALPADGGIVLDPLGGETLMTTLQENGRPVVTIGHPPAGVRAPDVVVESDHDGMCRAALDHLATRGYEQPALILNLSGASYASDIETSYRDWCDKRRLRPVIVRPKSPVYSEALEATGRLLSQSEHPDAILATGDQVALGSLHAAKELGLDVPQDLGIVALSGITTSLPFDLATPKLTVVDMHAAKVGRTAVRALIAILESEDVSKIETSVGFTLDVQESTRREA